MIDIRTIDQLDVADKRVFYRVDYNVPFDGGEVSDATRIEATLPTIFLLRERGARVVLASHLGRPKGQRNEKYSLAPVRRKLEEISGIDVAWADDCIGEQVRAQVDSLQNGQLLLLENLRFHEGEESNDPAFASELAALADIYVNDAFGACHRAHASIVGVPERLGSDRSAAGLLIARELEFLQKVTVVSDDARPFVAILGGAKIKGKIEPLQAMTRIADKVLIGGGMANTFLAAKGLSLGGSLVDEESIDVARTILSAGERAEILLPRDLVLTGSIETPSNVRSVTVGDFIGDSEMAVDIGSKSVDEYIACIEAARTIFWNGPMGVFEKDEFAGGTRAIAVAVSGSNAVSIVGGGESVEAVNQSGRAGGISHISTGGGASLEFVSGQSLPGIEVLTVK